MVPVLVAQVAERGVDLAHVFFDAFEIVKKSVALKYFPIWPVQLIQMAKRYIVCFTALST